MALPCTDICDGSSARVLDHAMARYTDRSSFANNAAQDGFNSMQFMFLTKVQQKMQRHGMADMMAQFALLPMLIGQRSR